MLSVTEASAPLCDDAKRERLRQLLVEIMDTNGDALVNICDVVRSSLCAHLLPHLLTLYVCTAGH